MRRIRPRTKRTSSGLSPSSMALLRDVSSSYQLLIPPSQLPSLKHLRLRQEPNLREHYLSRIRTFPRVTIGVRISEERSEVRTLAGQLVDRYTSIIFQAVTPTGSSVGLEDLLFLEDHTLRWWWGRWDRNAYRLLSPKQKVALLQETDGRIPRSIEAVKELLQKLDLLTDREIGHTFDGRNRLVEMIQPESLEALESFLVQSSKG